MTTFINFVKMHGLGNDIILLKRDEVTILGLGQGGLSRLAIEICHRRSGIGGDQVMVYSEDVTGSGETSGGVEVQIFNSDGSEPFQCGNGMRCLAAYLHTRTKARDVKIHLLDWKRVWDCSIAEDGKEVGVNMGMPELNADWMPSVNSIRKVIDAETKSKLVVLDIGLVDVGNPHLIIFTPLFEPHFEKDMEVLAGKFQNDGLFRKSGGVNVSFACVDSEKRIRLRVWERGAGAVLACGSAACAAFATAQKYRLVKGAGDVDVCFGEGCLKLMYNDSGQIIMRGPAGVVAIGKYFIKSTN